VLTDLRVDSLGRSLKKFRIVATGYIEVPADGIYSFFLPAGDNDELFIDDHVIIADGDPFSRIEKIGAAPLKKGLHAVQLDYTYEGGLAIPLDYQYADGERHGFAASQLFH